MSTEREQFVYLAVGKNGQQCYFGEESTALAWIGGRGGVRKVTLPFMPQIVSALGTQTAQPTSDNAAFFRRYVAEASRIQLEQCCLRLRAKLDIFENAAVPVIGEFGVCDTCGRDCPDHWPNGACPQPAKPTCICPQFGCPVHTYAGTQTAQPMDTMVLYATRYLWLKNESLNTGAKARLKILYRLEDSEWTTVSELDELDSFINQMYSAAFFPHPPQPVTPVEAKHEIRNNVDGSLDEIVGTGAFHFEQMSGTHWSLILGPVLVSLHSKTKLKATVVEVRQPVDAQGKV